MLHILDRCRAPCIKVLDYRGLDYTDFVYRRHDLRCYRMLFIIYNPVQFILSRHFKRTFHSLCTLFITASFLGRLVNLIPFQNRTRSVCSDGENLGQSCLFEGCQGLNRLPLSSENGISIVRFWSPNGEKKRLIHGDSLLNFWIKVILKITNTTLYKVFACRVQRAFKSM